MEEYILNIMQYLFTSKFSYVVYGKVYLRPSVCKVGLRNLGCMYGCTVHVLFVCLITYVFNFSLDDR
jgi:hypothetical protein